MISFWERDALLDYDYIVIGGGIIGLSTAIELRTRFSSASVLVLERGLFPTGASTRNAGFACYGSLTEILSDIRRNDADATLAVMERRLRGLQLLRQRLGDAAIGYEEYGGYELIFDDTTRLEHIDEINTLLAPVFGPRYFGLRNDLIPAFGFDEQRVQTLVYAPMEGQIHTGKMMKALAAYAVQHGVEIKTGAEVLSIEQTNNGVQVEVRNPAAEKSVMFRAQNAAVCTNAWVSRLLPGIVVRPGRGQVLLTEPVPDLPFRGVFHFDEGFYYFRNVGDRVLFGGGRNLAFAEEETHELSTSNRIQEALETLLQEVILPGRPFTVEMRWAGVMGFSDTKLPVVQKVADNIVVGFGCNGMGVALGSSVGREAAEVLCV
jgi:glycine/D-amino acid oxidase-like deaminating enzyme